MPHPGAGFFSEYKQASKLKKAADEFYKFMENKGRFKRKLDKCNHKSDVAIMKSVRESKVFKRIDDRRNCRPNYQIGPYFIDCYLSNLKVGIEADGSYHNGREEYDRKRDAFILTKGIKIVRIKYPFTQEQVDSLLRSIL